MKYSDEVIDAFALYQKNEDIAKAINKSIRTVQLYKKDEELQKQVEERRTIYTKLAVNKLQNSMNIAIDVLVDIIQNKEIKPQIRVNAISCMLNVCKPLIQAEMTVKFAKEHQTEQTENDSLSSILKELAKELQSDELNEMEDTQAYLATVFDE